jgi:hypothetical protein
VGWTTCFSSNGFSPLGCHSVVERCWPACYESFEFHSHESCKHRMKFLRQLEKREWVLAGLFAVYVGFFVWVVDHYPGDMNWAAPAPLIFGTYASWVAAKRRCWITALLVVSWGCFLGFVVLIYTMSGDSSKGEPPDYAIHFVLLCIPMWLELQAKKLIRRFRNNVARSREARRQ